ncbi:hypothetical protein [Pedobacter foliorum]|uniref:hypothetical protein n=1 Tax=Pedobacter foliorum TaxID=2739058 RepID=UPI001563C315|nr:hypothetical protein [Pedobacter foliorum]NRF39107.1 hypothetical protein [Pedobacter foliorum]
MNNIFNFNRFWLLVKRQWLEFGKIYLISLLVIAGVFVLFYLWNFPDPDKDYHYNSDGFLNLNFRIPLFLTSGFIFISVIASSYFSMLGQKAKAIIELMAPASSLEKWLCGLFYTSILSVFSFLLVFYIVDLTFVTSIEKSIGHITVSTASGAYPIPKTGVVGIRTLFSELLVHKEMRSMYGIPFMITSIFLLGSVYFNRFHYIKTAVVTLLFCSGLIYALVKVGMWLTLHKVQDSANFGYRSHNDEVFTFILIGTAFITLFFWTITFYRVKEKEV